MSKKLWSVFTDDMDHCYFTGTPYCHRHHIFYGPCRSMSEKYGFVIPIAYYLHENYPDSVHQNPNKGIDLELKQMAQKYFEEHYGTTTVYTLYFACRLHVTSPVFLRCSSAVRTSLSLNPVSADNLDIEETKLPLSITSSPK